MPIRRDPPNRGPEHARRDPGRLFTARGWGRRQGRLHLEKAWAEAAGPEFAAHTRVGPCAAACWKWWSATPCCCRNWPTSTSAGCWKQLRRRLPNTP